MASCRASTSRSFGSTLRIRNLTIGGSAVATCISGGEMGWRHPPADEEERRQREELRERHRNAARERSAPIGHALATVPRFELPDRTYYLLQGPLSALVGLR